MSKQLDYNTDTVKHFVRYNGWLEPFRGIKNYVDRELKAKRRDTRCRYLTFCAAQAVDVFMLEHGRYLYRDQETNRLKDVYFIENDEESFSIITKMIGSASQGFFGDFQSIILQPDIPDNEDAMDEPETEEEREALRLRDLKKSLLGIFPFDVINLDMYGNFFPKSEQRYSDSCQVYRQVLTQQRLRGQESCQKFLMFLTIYTPPSISCINPDSFSVLQESVYSNLSYQEFRGAFNERFSHIEPDKIEFYLLFLIGFVKRIIFKEGYEAGWEPTIKDIFCYDRTKPSSEEAYKMSTIVVEYKRNDNLLVQDFSGAIPQVVKKDYLEQLVSILASKPNHVPSEDSIPTEVAENLGEVIKFRNDFLRNIGIYNPNQFGVL